MKIVFSKSRIGLVLAAILMTVVIGGCSNGGEEGTEKLQVAVSIVPQATFVGAVAGDLVDIVTLVPPGASPANYQPTPQEMIDLEDSSIYFSIGVPTEAANIMPNMVADSDVEVVALHSIVGEVYEDRHFSETTRDPHIWLSPKRVIVMVKAIRDELSALDADNADTYTENAAAYIAELEDLDQEITEMFADEDYVDFIVLHPSFGYFADDYGLQMTSLEKDGKTATAEWIQEIIDFAVEEDIHVIYYQAEFDSTQAHTIAEGIEGKTVKVSPLSPEYINNLKNMAEAFLQN